MTPGKIITIVVLLILGVHLLMFGFLKRRIAEATRQQRRLDQERANAIEDRHDEA